MVEVLTNLIVVIVSQYICVYQIIKLYILKLHNVICQLYLDKAGAKTTTKLGMFLNLRKSSRDNWGDTLFPK